MNTGKRPWGEIVKINEKSAKIKILEPRGTGAGSQVGMVWDVPYWMMTLVKVKTPTSRQTIAGQAVEKSKLTYSQFQPQEDIQMLEAIASIYAQLSSENLHCDGEILMSEAEKRRRLLEKKLHHLIQAFGMDVSEHEVYEWQNQRRAAFLKAANTNSETGD